LKTAGTARGVARPRAGSLNKTAKDMETHTTVVQRVEIMTAELFLQCETMSLLGTGEIRRKRAT